MRDIVSSVQSGKQVPEKLVNVSVNGDLLRKAEALKINLSAMLEQTLAKQVLAHEREQWQRENAKAIAAYNQFTDEHRCFSDSAKIF